MLCIHASPLSDAAGSGNLEALNKIIDKFYEVIEKFIKWICKKFEMGAEDNLIRDFEKETKISLDAEKQIKHEEKEKEWNMEI